MAAETGGDFVVINKAGEGELHEDKHLKSPGLDVEMDDDHDHDKRDKHKEKRKGKKKDHKKSKQAKK